EEGALDHIRQVAEREDRPVQVGEVAGEQPRLLGAEPGLARQGLGEVGRRRGAAKHASTSVRGVWAWRAGPYSARGMAKAADPITDFDWAAHWRQLVTAAERCGPAEGDAWAGRAQEYHASRGQDWEPLLGVMEPWLQPHRTAIDVGAGTGRHAAPLARRLDWVTAVEPSEAMRA